MSVTDAGYIPGLVDRKTDVLPGSDKNDAASVPVR
jgi:hypothetical protein